MSELNVPGYDWPREIGRRGASVVHLARELRTGQDVAIRVLDSAGPGVERACRLAVALPPHPHLVGVRAFGILPDGALYVVTDLLVGQTLAERLERVGPLTWPLAVAMAVKLGGALQTAHQAGLLHGDVRPDNVLFSSYGEPKLADLAVGGAGRTLLAPEVLAGGRTTVASDVWALAATVRAALVGSGPETADLRTLGVPSPVVRALGLGLADSPGERPASALGLVELLRAAAATAGALVPEIVVLSAGQPVASGRTIIGFGQPVPVGAPSPATGSSGSVRQPWATPALPAARALPLTWRRPDGAPVVLGAAATTASVGVLAALLLSHSGGTPTAFGGQGQAGVPLPRVAAAPVPGGPATPRGPILPGRRSALAQLAAVTGEPGLVPSTVGVTPTPEGSVVILPGGEVIVLPPGALPPPGAVPSPTPSASPNATQSPTPGATGPTPSTPPTPTPAPTTPTPSPTPDPTVEPTPDPTVDPTVEPTPDPTVDPTIDPPPTGPPPEATQPPPGPTETVPPSEEPSPPPLL